MPNLSTITEPTSTSAHTPRPVWPLPKMNGRAPVLLVADPHDPGVELVYERNYDPDGALVRSAPREGDAPFFLPALTPVFSVFDGRILYAGKHLDGFTMIVEHPNGWMTYYSRLEHMFALPTDRRPRVPPQRVKAGHVLGLVGKLNPLAPVRPLRFELWKFDDDCGYLAIDPIRFMRRWGVVRWTSSRMPPAPGVPTPKPEAA